MQILTINIKIITDEKLLLVVVIYTVRKCCLYVVKDGPVIGA